MRVICRLTVHKRFVSVDLSADCTDVSTHQNGNFSKRFTIFVKFPYTTTLFYGKMMVVHINLLACNCFDPTTIIPEICMNFFFFFGCCT